MLRDSLREAANLECFERNEAIQEVIDFQGSSLPGRKQREKMRCSEQTKDEAAQTILCQLPWGESRHDVSLGANYKGKEKRRWGNLIRT